MKELVFEQLESVNGGDRGDAGVADAIAGSSAGWHALRDGSWGARLGSLAGPLRAAGGVVIGAGLGVLIYQISV